MIKFIVVERFKMVRSDIQITFYKNQEWYARDYEVDELKIGYTRFVVPYDELKHYDDYDIIETDNDAKTAFIEIKKRTIALIRGNICVILDVDIFKKYLKEMN